jgi:hypothetical protein
VTRISARTFARAATVTAALWAAPVLAQGSTRTASSVLSTTVAGVFGYSPAAPTVVQSAQTSGLCSAGTCFTTSLTARGNTRWQLQVKTTTDPNGYKLYYAQATAPAGVQTPGSGTLTELTWKSWTTVATSTSASAGATIGVTLKGVKASGKNGVAPTAATVQSYLMWQVVALP